MCIKLGIPVPAATWNTRSKKRGCRQPAPALQRVWERLRSCHAGERAGSWQLAWPQGIRDSPTFPAHMVAHAAAEPTKPPFFFFPACPVLSQALITAAGGLGRDSSAHIMQEPWDAGGLSVPSAPLSKPLFSRASPAPAIWGWSLDPSGGKHLFWGGIRNHSNILVSLIYEWFFSRPFSPSCVFLWLKHWSHSLGSISTFTRTRLEGMHCMMVSWMLTWAADKQNSPAVPCRYAAYACWFHLLIPISSRSTQMTSIKADYPFLLLAVLLITHISFGWGVWSSPDLISTQGSSGCFDHAVFEQKWPRDLWL